MIGLIFIFLIVLLSYYVFLKKKYSESRDKQLFLRTNFYRSNLWIIIMVFFCLLVVNLFAPDIPLSDTDQVEPSAKQRLDSLEKIRRREALHVNFHYDYLNTYAKEKNLNTRPFVMVDDHISKYYDSIANAGASDVANWGMGYYYLKWKKKDSVTFYFKDLPEDFGYKNLAMAELYSLGHEDSLTTEYLKEEVRNPQGAKGLAVKKLIDHYQPMSDYHSLKEVLELEGASDYFPFHLHRKLYYLDADLASYYEVVILHFLNGINGVGLVAALMIAVVWFFYIWRLAFFQKVKTWEIAMCLFLGIVFTFLTYLFSDALSYHSEGSALWNTFTWSVIGIGAIEELVKIIPLLLVMLVVRRRLEAFEYILFASVSAIGFAFTENLLYFDGSYGLIITGRALTAAVGHMIDSSIFAYAFVLGKVKNKKHVILYFFVFWGLASLVHGLYDFFLFIDLYLFFILFFLLCSRIWITILNNSINQSAGFTYSSDFNSRRLQFFVTFLLTGILMFEYLVVGFSLGKDQAFISLLAAFFTGGFLIAFLGTKLTSLNLVKGYWSTVNFSVNPFTDDIVTQNFVGSKIMIKPYHGDRGFINYFDEVAGVIARRVVLQNKERTFFMAHDDSKWFLVKLVRPVQEQGVRSQYVLVKLKDNYSSLNDQKQFMAHFLLIPNEVSFKDSYPFRKEFRSLGWVWISAV